MTVSLEILLNIIKKILDRTNLEFLFVGRVMLQPTCQLATAIVSDISPLGSGNSIGLTRMGGPHLYVGLSSPSIFHLWGGYSTVRFKSGGILYTWS
jgi:hypothetical protein